MDILSQGRAVPAPHRVRGWAVARREIVDPVVSQ